MKNHLSLFKMTYKSILTLLVSSTISPFSYSACPVSHPLECGGACYVDANQAASGGCTVNGGNDSNNNLDNNNGSSSNNNNSDNSSNNRNNAGDNCASDDNPSLVVSGRRTEFTQPDCDTVCVTMVGNGTGCLNAQAVFVSNANVCSDPENAREAIIDIEFNLGIDIDDNFIASVGYQGPPPSINPVISTEDARTYFRALLGRQEGDELTDALNTNGDSIIDRNEASQAKGADPRQVLTTGFGCGLSTDDIMSYLGLYIGDGAIDKYAGDLDSSVKNNLLEFTRSWQPGVDARDCEYRGGC